jgi:hypothetical protein
MPRCFAYLSNTTPLFHWTDAAEVYYIALSKYAHQLKIDGHYQASLLQ